MKGSRALLVLLASLTLACSPPSRYRVLSFFFDGVPPPRPKPEAPAPGDASAPRPARIKQRDHGPYAARMCEGCHDTGRGNKLLAPVDELCGRCHTLGLEKRYVHGPLTAGSCVLCHDPHRSAFPFLLVSDSSTFCARCHERRALREVEGHEEGAPSCTTCHEAHMSDRPFLLK